MSLFDCIPELKLDAEMVEIAGQIIERKSAAFDPSAFQDHYAVRMTCPAPH